MNPMGKSESAGVRRLWLASASVLFVLTISLTTATMTPLNEGFEAGGKTAYAAANVTLGTGSWYMDDALTGNLSTNRKTGSDSVRIRNTCRVHMIFNMTAAGADKLQHEVLNS